MQTPTLAAIPRNLQRRAPGRPSREAMNRTDGQLPLRPLTERELDILKLSVKGFTHDEVARLLGTKYGSVKASMRSIYTKLDCTRTIEAVVWAVRNGIA